MPKRDFAALAVLESDSLPRTIRAHDIALKAAPCQVLASAPLSPGKAVLMLVGDVAAVQEAFAPARDYLASTLIDQVFLPGVHGEIKDWLAGNGAARLEGCTHGGLKHPDKQPLQHALGVVECRTVAAAIESLDGALKMAVVRLGRLHLAQGFGGKTFYTLLGEQSDVEAAMETVALLAGDRLLDNDIVAAPHEELAEGLFVRPWGMDPTS